MYFGMSVSAPYLEATVTAAAVARQRGDLKVFVNISHRIAIALTAHTPGVLSSLAGSRNVSRTLGTRDREIAG